MSCWRAPQTSPAAAMAAQGCRGRVIRRGRDVSTAATDILEASVHLLVLFGVRLRRRRIRHGGFGDLGAGVNDRIARAAAPAAGGRSLGGENGGRSGSSTIG